MDAEAISLLIEHVIERRVCEMVLVVLDLLCGCAEGRAQLLRCDGVGCGVDAGVATDGATVDDDDAGGDEGGEGRRRRSG